jgi:cyclic pyranopterin phosphate synthase
MLRYAIIFAADKPCRRRLNMPQFTHLDEKGKARMVDVSEKDTTRREAVARGKVLMKPQTAKAIERQSIAKGDVLAVAKIAGIMAAKKTSELIPLCHPLEITAVDVSFRTDTRRGEIEIEATVRTLGRTGVEMEALTAVSAAALTIYDMCKAVDRGMTLSEIRLTLKRGGKSGTYRRKD